MHETIMKVKEVSDDDMDETENQMEVDWGISRTKRETRLKRRVHEQQIKIYEKLWKSNKS